MYEIFDPTVVFSLAAITLFKSKPRATQEASNEVTIYNNKFAVIKESRTLDIQEGEQTVSAKGVASTIQPDSVAIKAIDGDLSFEIHEQNYAYDLVSPNAILKKAIGEMITINRRFADGTTERIEGKLLSVPERTFREQHRRIDTATNVYGEYDRSFIDEHSFTEEGGMMIEATDGRIIIDPVGEIELSSVPKGLNSMPTLFWKIDSTASGPVPVELSYVADQITWEAVYVVVLDNVGSKGALKAWIKLHNKCGKSFTDVKLNLVTGNVDSVLMETTPPDVIEVRIRPHEREEFGDYHLYMVPRLVSVRDKEMKHISLVNSDKLKVDRKLVARFSAVLDVHNGKYQRPEIGYETVRNPVVELSFKNTNSNDLGVPLPSGTFRVYQPHSTGSLQLLGEHTTEGRPIGTQVKLQLGEAFDVKASRTLLSYDIKENHTFSTRQEVDLRYEVTITNARSVPEVVHIVEQINSNYLLEVSLQGVKRLKDRAVMPVKVPANGEVKLKYRILTVPG